MSNALSPNTQAILLLTAPLITARNQSASEIFTPGEYKRLVRGLREAGRQPADFLQAGIEEWLQLLKSEFDIERIKRLLSRSFQLSDAVARWQSRSIWVMSRADSEYPNRIKSRLKEDAPPILYGCGERPIPESDALAIVGSRDVDEALLAYTDHIGRLAAEAKLMLVSGGARGIDQAAMRSALDAGGKVIGVMADSLDRAAVDRAYRAAIMNGQLVLLSPYDPMAGFNVGNAMQRNKLIYAFATAALVVNSDYEKGGTWIGAVEQLNRLKLAPVYIRTSGAASQGLDGLRLKGALPWPEPSDARTLLGIMTRNNTPQREQLPAVQYKLGAADTARLDIADKQQDVAVEITLPPQPAPSVLSPSDELYTRVREILLRQLNVPRKEGELATVLNVSPGQLRLWLKRLVEEGVIEKQTKPIRYALKQTGLFDTVTPLR